MHNNIWRKQSDSTPSLVYEVKMPGLSCDHLSKCIQHGMSFSTGCI